MGDNSIGAAGWRILKLLVGTPPQTVRQLQAAAGVTRTAVTEQLGTLLEAGLIEFKSAPASRRGRPRHLFSATRSALVLVAPQSQQTVVPAIWRALAEAGGTELSSKVGHRMSRKLADYYCAQITAKEPKERLRRLVNILRNEGGVLEIRQEDGATVVYRRTCPFMSMMDDKRLTCVIDLEMINLVVGHAVRRTACRMDGAPCCTLRIDAA